MWISIVTNSTILFIYVPSHPEVGLVAEYEDKKFMKIRISFQLLFTFSSCVSWIGSLKLIHHAKMAEARGKLPE